jgi:hypothetical protein
MALWNPGYAFTIGERCLGIAVLHNIQSSLCHLLLWQRCIENIPCSGRGWYLIGPGLPYFFTIIRIYKTLLRWRECAVTNDEGRRGESECTSPMMPKLLAPLCEKEMLTAWGSRTRPRLRHPIGDNEAKRSGRWRVGEEQRGWWTLDPSPSHHNAPDLAGELGDKHRLGTHKQVGIFTSHQPTHPPSKAQTCARRHDLFAKGSNHLGN